MLTENKVKVNKKKEGSQSVSVFWGRCYQGNANKGGNAGT